MAGRQKMALVLGAGGFVGSHLVRRLIRENYWVRGVDTSYPKFSETAADDFVIADLRDPTNCLNAIDATFDEVYQLASDMGGAGYLFTGLNDAEIMHNSALINLNVLESCRRRRIRRLFYSSSACVYPVQNQLDPKAPITREDSVYPANPDSEYGWEKLFSERMFSAYQRNHGLEVRMARYHNIFGPEGTWTGGREKAPAAICRKVAEAPPNGEIEIWGDGQQTRSFLYIDECLEGTIRLMRSGWSGPVNIGSEEMVTINGLAQIVIDISGKNLKINNIAGPLGVRGRNSNNELIEKQLGWKPVAPLRSGLEQTYAWICNQVDNMSGRQPLAANPSR
jgi:GDP-D-mannose 3',5'-epimerase